MFGPTSLDSSSEASKTIPGSQNTSQKLILTEMLAFFRAFGQTLGVAISGVIFQNTLKSYILSSSYSIYAGTWSRDASSLVQVVKTWSNEGAEGEMKKFVIGAYVESLRMVWVVMCVLAGLMFMCSVLWIKELGLHTGLETDQGFRFKGDKKNPNAMDEESN
jgi:hypothetical protein